MPDIQLNDCKKCGSPAVMHNQKLMPTEKFKEEFIVICGTCTNRGEWQTDEFEAAQIWNSRNRLRHT